MRKVLDHSNAGREAARQLLELRQGPRSAHDYAIEVRTLAAAFQWDTQALYDTFLNGLSELPSSSLRT